MPNVSKFGAQTDNSVVQGTVTDRAMVIPDIPPQGLMSVGPRVTPHFVKPSLWSALTTYHFFDAVHDAAGASYVAIKPEVPAGTELTDEGYWFLWADPNSQLADLTELVKTYANKFDDLQGQIDVTTHVYATVASMKADADLKAGMFARTRGFRAANDGGGALYAIIPGTTEDPANISLENGLTASLYGDTVSLLQLGAYGDGVNDDSAAITASTGYRNVYVNDGKRFRFVTTTEPLIYNDSNLFGTGTIVVKGSVPFDREGAHIMSHVTFYNMQDKTVEGVHFEDADKADKCVTLFKCENLHLKGIKSINKYSGWNITVWDCDNVYVTDSIIVSESSELFNDALHISSKNVFVTNNYIYSGGDDAIGIGYNPKNQTAGTYPIDNTIIENIIVTGNRAISKASRAISCFVFENETSIKNVCCNGNVLEGLIALIPGNTAEFTDHRNISAVIENNVIHTPNIGNSPSVMVANCDSVSFKGNVVNCTDHNNAFVFINAINDFDCSNNKFSSNVTKINAVNIIPLGTQSSFNAGNIRIADNVFSASGDGVYTSNCNVEKLVVSGCTFYSSIFSAFTGSTVNEIQLIGNFSNGDYAIKPYNIWIPKRNMKYLFANNIYTNELSNYTDTIVFTTNLKLNSSTAG